MVVSNVSSIFYVHPGYGEDEPILTHIFQMGWFNHQPGILPCPSDSKVLIDLGSGVEVLVLHNPLGDLDEHLAKDGAWQLGILCISPGGSQDH